MTKKSNKIVFFGSGPVAEKSLKLLAQDFDIELVITKPSTLSMMRSVVPKTTVITVQNKTELDKLIKSHNFESRLGVLIDFGIIVSAKVIGKFPLGIVNSHFSLLPEWRGADPISFALLSGQEKTGVSLMIISEGMDEGEILGYTELNILKNDNSTTLTDKLIKASNNQLTACIPLYIDGEIKPLNQIQAGQSIGIADITYSRKLTKLDGKIDWKKTAQQLEREIRAFIEWPKSYTKLGKHEIIIRHAKVVEKSGEPGQYHVDNNSLVVYCGKNALEILALQPVGKKEMSIGAFLNGYKI